MTFFVGTAGWTLPRDAQASFPETGSHLERYAGRFRAAEINSTFYRSHRPATLTRWSASVGDDFRFAVKLPKRITHEHRLVAVHELLDAFLAETALLGDRRGPLLVQLPPSFAFDADVATEFFAYFRSRHAGSIALEPRHATWLEPDAVAVLTRFRISRVAAEPASVPLAGTPLATDELAYFRLHGSPRIYYSSYDDAYLDALAGRLRAAAASSRDVWCIFDNTAHGAAAVNALATVERLDVGA